VEVSPPVAPHAADVDLRDLPPAREWLPGEPVEERPRLHVDGLPQTLLEPRGYGLDFLIELEDRAPAPGSRLSSSPDLNVAAQGFTGVVPPDPVGVPAVLLCKRAMR
jgi:hypothetical protein